MRTIKVDDDVYGALAARVQGFETPNDVLRRIVLTDKAEAAVVMGQGLTAHGGRPGNLTELLSAGLIAAGDELEHHRVRKGQVLRATVGQNGEIVTDLGVYSAPSAALKALVGTDINGWKSWTHVRSGKTLSQLRNQLTA